MAAADLSDKEAIDWNVINGSSIGISMDVTNQHIAFTLQLKFVEAFQQVNCMTIQLFISRILIASWSIYIWLIMAGRYFPNSQETLIRVFYAHLGLALEKQMNDPSWEIVEKSPGLSLDKSNR